MMGTLLGLLLSSTTFLVQPCGRRNFVAAAVMAAPFVHTPSAAHAAASKLLEAAGISVKEPSRSSAPSAALNEAEQKLADVLAKTVAEKEAALGFKYEANDIDDIEQILRAKYCGPQGMYNNLPGGGCKAADATPTCFKGNTNINSLGIKDMRCDGK